MAARFLKVIDLREERLLISSRIRGRSGDGGSGQLNGRSGDGGPGN